MPAQKKELTCDDVIKAKNRLLKKSRRASDAKYELECALERVIKNKQLWDILRNDSKFLSKMDLTIET